MGCDIHATLEQKQEDGSWCMVRRLTESKNYYGGNFGDRHYLRFSALADCGRGNGPEPKGLPDDISRGSQIYADEWEDDGHSHSWELIDDELIARLISPDALYEGESPPQDPHDHWFGIDRERDAHEYRVVFWFDN